MIFLTPTTFRYLIVASLLITHESKTQPAPLGALPEGEGKRLVEIVCYNCHGQFQIMSSSGYDSSGWKNLISSMVNLPIAQQDTISKYLEENFPPRTERKPTLIDGPIDIQFEEWIAPTLGQRVRDPVEGADGAIWWTGMWASLIGRLDPTTGEMTEFHLPITSRPHSIFPDSSGNFWYTGNSNGTIGYLNTSTGLITEFPTESNDPHTATLHPNGKLYFTAQQSNMLGELDPSTGELREIKTETRPYGIKFGKDGTLWVAYNGTNKIGALNPETMDVHYYDVPDDRSRIRRLDLDSSGMIWFVNSSLGKLGRLDPSNGQISQWDSPSGPDSHPYAIAVIDDKVWYNESGKRPDTLVRFDPENESFQSWAIPSGYGIVRNMWVTRESELLIHQSSSNRIGRVTISKE